MLDRKEVGGRMTREPSNGDRVPILEPKDPRDLDRRSSSVNLPSWMWERLEEIVSESGYSRNEIAERFLRWAFDQYTKEVGEGRKPKK
jgi:hypothetical protein